MSSYPKDFRTILKNLKPHGWTATQGKNRHWHIHGPEGQQLVAPSTPSDHRAFRNTVAALRRAGAPIPR